MTRLARLDPWIEGYLGYLGEVRRQTRRTVSDVRCTLKRASEAFAASHPGRALWELELVDFLRWLERERAAGRTASCRAKYVSHLRGLLDYTWRSGRSDRNVLDGLSLRPEVRRAPRVLTLAEAERLVAACPQQTAASRRDRLIVLLLYGCGLRTSELCGLRVQDVDLAHELVRVRGKGGHERSLPLNRAVTRALALYRQARGEAAPAAPFFVSRLRGPLTRTGVYERVRTWARRARLAKRVSPHRLRHTFATHLVRAGVGLVTIRDLLGHRQLTSTQLYLHVTAQDLREAADRHPIARLAHTVASLLPDVRLPLQRVPPPLRA